MKPALYTHDISTLLDSIKQLGNPGFLKHFNASKSSDDFGCIFQQAMFEAKRVNRKPYELPSNSWIPLNPRSSRIRPRENGGDNASKRTAVLLIDWNKNVGKPKPQTTSMTGDGLYVNSDFGDGL